VAVCHFIADYSDNNRVHNCISFKLYGPCVTSSLDCLDAEIIIFVISAVTVSHSVCFDLAFMAIRLKHSEVLGLGSISRIFQNNMIHYCSSDTL